MRHDLIPPACLRDYLSIGKRDADCYDVSDGNGRIAALRSDFTTDPSTGARTPIPHTWRIRWEFEDDDRRRIKMPAYVADMTFRTVHEAFAFFCSQVLR